jgi:hypothetical protein
VQLPGRVCSIIEHKVERALRRRVRYRYVQPRVLAEGQGFRIQSPCCSRNVDSGGGLIDIALLLPQSGGLWSLCARDHAGSCWQPFLLDEPLEKVLDALCLDSERRFWP